MLRPSYAELMDTMSEKSEKDVTSRYTVVIAAAKRARQLIDGDESMAEEKVASNKPVSIAVEEIREGKITVVPEGQGTKLKPKKADIDEAEIKRELEEHKTAEKEVEEDDLELSEDNEEYDEDLELLEDKETADDLELSEDGEAVEDIADDEE